MCEICGHNPHLPGCPYYSPPKSQRTGMICCQCGEEILKDEPYVENWDGETVHLECADDMDWLIDWLGGRIFT